MAEQVLIQVRIDSELKAEAADVFDRIGIDIPTAIRMFFKAAVREQGLPFSAQLRGDRSSGAASDRLVRYLKDMVLYDPPIEGEDVACVVVLPLNGGEIPTAMFVQLVAKIPAGRIARCEDIFAYLSDLYHQDVYRFPDRALPLIDSNNEFIPYWRLVSTTGALINSLFCSRDYQKRKLEEEGVRVVPRGKLEGSYRVENYKELLFDFRSLRPIRSNGSERI